MTNRVTRTKTTYRDRDVFKTIKTDDYQYSGDDCFGSMWDLNCKECRLCHDSDLCGVLTNSKVTLPKEKKASENVVYLDEIDWDAVDTEEIKKEANGKDTAWLFDVVSKMSKCDDKESLVRFIKEWVQSDSQISIKGGICSVKY